MNATPTLTMIALTFALAAVSASDARADAPPPARALGVDAVVALPLGDYADVASAAAGPMGRAAFPAGP
ncbi:MAG: hypothetical protein KA201_27665, partial [Kofleriaceae bacterium]|nr:hypothetical protein [Kofleriaceae bacterium]